MIQKVSTGLVDICLEINGLVIISNGHCPTEQNDGKKTLHSDLSKGLEQANNIIIQQINYMSQQNCSINVICEDIFIVICHFCSSKEWNAKVFMDGFTSDFSTTISINERIKKHKSIIPSVTAAYTFIGCDSVPNLLQLFLIWLRNRRRDSSTFFTNCTIRIQGCTWWAFKK